ncbi:MAG TPA: LemA family protein [Candidatus Deferrimicrobiaceae bacterium]|jgi:LemA protein
MHIRENNRGGAGVVVAAVLGGLLLIVLLAGGWLVGKYNTIQKMTVAVDQSWGQVQNVLQRRADLIPNLVSTVKGYSIHEKDVLANISAARAALGGAKTPTEAMKANGELSGALSRLLVVVENYPNLKADTQFTRLMDELAGAENRIAVERKRYNDSIGVYNSYIVTFPNSLVAGFAGAQKKPFFEAEAGAKEVPKVDFGK